MYSLWTRSRVSVTSPYFRRFNFSTVDPEFSFHSQPIFRIKYYHCQLDNIVSGLPLPAAILSIGSWNMGCQQAQCPTRRHDFSRYKIECQTQTNHFSVDDSRIAPGIAKSFTPVDPK